MIDSSTAASALLIGLAGAGHCLGMCGGITAALNLSGNASHGITLAYHVGRVGSYTLLGALAGAAAGSIDIAAWTIGLRYAAGLLLIGMGLYIANLWHGIAVLERAGAFLWRPVQNFSARLIPLQHRRHAFLLGMCWGLMPCGLIYSSLAWAATAQSPASAALMMLIFGVGTLPAMLAASVGAGTLQQLLRSKGLKWLIGLLLVIAGLWTLVTAGHIGSDAHSHGPHPVHHQDH